MRRSRVVCGVLAGAVMAAGLLVRSEYGQWLPPFVATYAGDCLWALLVYLLFAGLMPAAQPVRIAICAVVFALGIELSQLYQAGWANRIRDLPAMRLVFGYGFLWSDLVCYATGIMIGLCSETLWRLLQKKKADPS